MREKKNVLSVAEAKQQLKDCAAVVKPKEYLVDNLWQAALGSFILGMVSADSVKIRENLVSLIVTGIKKAI